MRFSRRGWKNACHQGFKDRRIALWFRSGLADFWCSLPVPFSSDGSFFFLRWVEFWLLRTFSSLACMPTALQGRVLLRQQGQQGSEGHRQRAKTQDGDY